MGAARRLSDRQYQSAFVLARLFTAERLEDLPERLQQLAANRSAEPLAPGTRCLTLLGTDGDLVEWQSPATSRAHQVIPLPSRDPLSRAPTVAALVRELGMDAAALLDEVDAADFDRVGTHSDIFYVADAPGIQRLIPDQLLVAEHGVRSVVGFGGLLPAGRERASETSIRAVSRLLTAASAAQAARRSSRAVPACRLCCRGATSIQQLAAIIIERGLAALGADGGAVAVKTPQGNLQVAPSDSLGERLRRDYTTMHLDSPLPASVAAATGRTVLLHNAEESLAWSPEMALVLP